MFCYTSFFLKIKRSHRVDLILSTTSLLEKMTKHRIKIFDLTREIMIEPREGTGKPERLKYFE